MKGNYYLHYGRLTYAVSLQRCTAPQVLSVWIHLLRYKVPLKRSTLCKFCALKDRQLRHVLSALREAGVPIVNNQDGKGYYIAQSAKEARSIARREKRRSLLILKAAIALNSWADCLDMVNQTKLEI